MLETSLLWCDTPLVPDLAAGVTPSTLDPWASSCADPATQFCIHTATFVVRGPRPTCIPYLAFRSSLRVARKHVLDRAGKLLSNIEENVKVMATALKARLVPYYSIWT